MRTRSIATVLVLAAITGQANALGIVATYDGSITASAKATLQQLVMDYNAHFTGTTEVRIKFQNGGGLGGSSTYGSTVPYATYLTALTAHKMSADDNTALAHLPATNNDVLLTTALQRELGIHNWTTGDGVAFDSTISLNQSICFDGHTTPVAGEYDIYSVAAHELDEALGTSSGVGSQNMNAADLFRYDGAGNRSFTTDTRQHAWFSIDGTTNLVEYNAFGRTTGDWGDWVHHDPNPQVQDWSGTPGVVINPGSNEYRLLDVVGYNQAVPEPGTWAALSVGALAVLRRRRSR